MSETTDAKPRHLGRARHLLHHLPHSPAPRWIYAILKRAVRFSLLLRYRRVEVHGLTPLLQHDKPLVLCANHQNALMDALLIASCGPWWFQLFFLGRADLFFSALLRPVLYLCNALPVFRNRDKVDTQSLNQSIFEISGRWVHAGRPMILFAEGTHLRAPHVRPLKKGFARVLPFIQGLDGADGEAVSDEVLFVPVGLHYSHHLKAGTDVLIQFGEPVSCLQSEHPELWSDDDSNFKEHKIEYFKDQIEQRLRALVLHSSADADNRQRAATSAGDYYAEPSVWIASYAANALNQTAHDAQHPFAQVGDKAKASHRLRRRFKVQQYILSRLECDASERGQAIQEFRQAGLQVRSLLKQGGIEHDAVWLRWRNAALFSPWRLVLYYLSSAGFNSLGLISRLVFGPASLCRLLLKRSIKDDQFHATVDWLIDVILCSWVAIVGGLMVGWVLGSLGWGGCALAFLLGLFMMTQKHEVYAPTFRFYAHLLGRWRRHPEAFRNLAESHRKMMAGLDSLLSDMSH